MSQTTTMTIRVTKDVKDRLDHLATATHRSKSFLAAEAIQEYIQLNEWQIEEIKDSLNEADAGDFASEKEVADTFKQWGVNAD